MSTSSTPLPLGALLYRLLLVAYPRRFRTAWGDDMVHALAAKLRRKRQLAGRGAEAAALAGAIGDLLRTALLERLGLRSRYSRTTSPRPPRRPKGSFMVTRLLWNLRTAFRSIVRQPALSSIIVLMLTAGAGGTIAFFAVVDAAVLRPLPYPDSERLVSLSHSSERFGLYGWAAPFIEDLQARTDSYDSLVGFSPSWRSTMTDPGEPQVVEVAFIGRGVLELMGTRLVAGRLIAEAEYEVGAAARIVVSESFWQRHFGEAELTPGQTVTFDGTVGEIVGLLADDTRMPIVDSAVSVGSRGIEVWAPVAQNPFLMMRARPIMHVIGRLAEGVGVQEAGAELEAVNQGLHAEFPDAGLDAPTIAMSLAERVASGSRRVVLLLFGAAAFLLLIACANVANLLLARATARSEEIAIRASLGASRRRLLEQLMVENGLLALLACLGGLGVAAVLLRVLPAILFLQLPPSAVLQIDLRIAAFAILLSVGTTMIFGLAPALHATRARASLAPGTGTRVAGDGARRLRGALVAAEVALAVVLLVGAGLLSRSFARLAAVNPGFVSHGVLSAPVSLGQARWSDAGERRVFFTELVDRTRALPGVIDAAAVNRIPLGGANVFVGVEIEGGTAGGEPLVNMDRRVTTPGYFSTMGIPLLGGRDFEASDRSDSDDRVAVINRTAMGLFPDEIVLGRRLRLQLRGGFGPWLRVVGVVEDIRHHGLDAGVQPEIYVPYEQATVQTMVLVARADDDPAALIEPVKATVWNFDDEIALDGIEPLADIVSGSITDPRVRMFMMQAFAALALGLAGLGIAGVVQYSVARRSRDYGIRLALGAKASEVLRLALREGLVPGSIGALIGIAAASGLTRLLASVLYETSPADPLTFVAVAGVLLGIIALASWIPARRATRVDPVVVLRDD